MSRFACAMTVHRALSYIVTPDETANYGERRASANVFAQARTTQHPVASTRIIEEARVRLYSIESLMRHHRRAH